jgi:hypothetical protein
MLLRQLLKQKESWEEVTYDDPASAPISYLAPAHAF